MRAVLLMLALAACAPSRALMQDGPAMSPPPGWTAFCERHPDDPAC